MLEFLWKVMCCNTWLQKEKSCFKIEIYLPCDRLGDVGFMPNLAKLSFV